MDIGALTGLRGVAALWVLIYHLPHERYAEPINWLVTAIGAAGHLGVELFFVLSGFVISLNYAHARLHSSVKLYGTFLLKRLARIYPVHIVMLAAFAFTLLAFDVAGAQFISDKHSRAVDLWQSILLIHAWETPLAFPWNGPSWSISAEWGAYLFFPALSLVICRIRHALVATLLIALLFALLFHAQMQYSYFDVQVTAARLFGCFTVGCLLHRLFVFGIRLRYAGPALCCLIVGANAFEISHRAFAAAPIFAPLCAVVVLGLASGGKAAKILALPCAQYLGRISYSLYMVHVFIMHMVRALDLSPHVAIVTTIGASLGAAHLLYYYVEEPARKKLTASGPVYNQANRVRPLSG